MGTISKINLIEQAEQYVLSIRKIIRFEEFPQIAEQCYAKIGQFALQNDLLFSGCPFVCYHNVDLENLDTEIGFPVARPIQGNGEIVGRSIPAEKVVTGLFQGAFEETDPLMMDILQWINEHGYEAQGRIINYFLNEEDRLADQQ